MKYTVYAAMSIDGYIARHEQEFTNWTSQEDKAHMRAHLDSSDVIVVGNNTYKTAIEPLSKRRCIVFTRGVQNVQQINDHSVYINPKHTDVESYLRIQRFFQIAVLGGTQTYSYCLCYNKIDEMYLTIEPTLFGSGLSLFDTKVEYTANFHLQSHRILNQRGSVLLHYTLK